MHQYSNNNEQQSMNEPHNANYTLNATIRSGGPKNWSYKILISPIWTRNLVGGKIVLKPFSKTEKSGFTARDFQSSVPNPQVRSSIQQGKLFVIHASEFAHFLSWKLA